MSGKNGENRSTHAQKIDGGEKMEKRKLQSKQKRLDVNRKDKEVKKGAEREQSTSRE